MASREVGFSECVISSVERSRDLCITSPFAQFLRQAQILILEISNIFLWLKFSPSLNLNKIEHSAKVSSLVSLSGYIGKIFRFTRNDKLMNFYETINFLSLFFIINFYTQGFDFSEECTFMDTEFSGCL